MDDIRDPSGNDPTLDIGKPPAVLEPRRMVGPESEQHGGDPSDEIDAVEPPAAMAWGEARDIATVRRFVADVERRAEANSAGPQQSQDVHCAALREVFAEWEAKYAH